MVKFVYLDILIPSRPRRADYQEETCFFLERFLVFSKSRMMIFNILQTLLKIGFCPIAAVDVPSKSKVKNAITFVPSKLGKVFPAIALVNSWFFERTKMKIQYGFYPF